ncbi:hypothetical protein B9Z19DRAFT_1193728, partial [Tuber borchii]
MSNNDGKSPDTKGVLRRAKSNTPIKVAPYPQKSHYCPIPSCGRSFKKLLRFEKHVRAHTQERPSTSNVDEKPPAFSWGSLKEEPKKAEEAHHTPFSIDSEYVSAATPWDEDGILQNVFDVSGYPWIPSHSSQTNPFWAPPSPTPRRSTPTTLNITEPDFLSLAEQDAEDYMRESKLRQDQQPSHLVQSEWSLAVSPSSYNYDSVSSYATTPENPIEPLDAEFGDGVECEPEASTSELQPREDKQTSFLALSQSPLAGSAFSHDYEATNSSSAATPQGGSLFPSL